MDSGSWDIGWVAILRNRREPVSCVFWAIKGVGCVKALNWGTFFLLMPPPPSQERRGIDGENVQDWIKGLGFQRNMLRMQDCMPESLKVEEQHRQQKRSNTKPQALSRILSSRGLLNQCS